MQQFSFEESEIRDFKIINPFYADDDRGVFLKFFEKDIFKEHGINMEIVYESSESISKKGVIRGLHFQTSDPQAKLVRVSYGKILDVVVDLRKDSKTFGKHHSEILSDVNKKIFYVPRGFAHGFICLSEVAIVSYLCDGKYCKSTDGGILWNDDDLNIDWHLDEVDKVIISEKDKNLQSFKKFCENNTFGIMATRKL